MPRGYEFVDGVMVPCRDHPDHPEYEDPNASEEISTEDVGESEVSDG